MGDEVPRQQLPNGDFQVYQQDLSPPLPAANLPQQGSQQDMKVSHYPQQQRFASGQPGVASMDMRSLGNALPNYQQLPSFQQQYPANALSHPSQFPYQQTPQFTGQAAGQFQHNLAQTYAQPYFSNQSRLGSGQNLPPGFQQQYMQIQQSMAGSGQPYMQHQSYGSRVPPYQGQLRLSPVSGMGMYQQPQPIRRTSSNSSLQASTLRGPPRKPKQSGHALWVGNLPPGAHIVDLKDHFSTDATHDIESVFLISKSNCAFVNYKTEASCAAAMIRFHDSRFQGVRLVCRLRRGSNSGSPTPQPLSSTQTPSQLPMFEQTEVNTATDTPEEQSAEKETEITAEPPQVKVKEKFFVVKSLTMEDLERSVASGVWATQAHNEDALNRAYQSAENVYLIFSANKSGEYFGYARMESAIDDEASSKLEVPIRAESSVDPSSADLPLTIPTPATATAPKGRVIDDSARGTIFWEADNDEEDDQGEASADGYESGLSAGGVSPAKPQTFGKPFKISWVSTERLPFYRTRGLRNPWNSNREVKIARDGTEIEPSVGRRLTSMFHRPQFAPTSPPGVRQQSGMIMPQGFMSPPGHMPGNPYGRSY